MKKKIPVVILAAIVVFIYIFRLLMVNRGFNTLYDEAFFLLALQDAKLGVIDGATQWNLLAVKLLPFVNLSSKANTYIVNIVISLIMAALMAVATSYIHIKKYGEQNRLRIGTCYFLVSMTVSLLFLYYNQEFTYVSLQALLFVLSMNLFIYGIYCDSIWKQRLLVLALGAVAIWPFFVILPSGLCMLFCWPLLLIVLEWKNWRKIAFCLLFYIIGVVFGLVVFHFCIVDLTIVFEKMRATASHITSSVRGYDPLSFIKNIVVFIRDFVLVFVVVYGAWCVWNRMEFGGRFKMVLSVGLFLLLVMLIYLFQEKALYTSSMLCMAIAAIPLFLVITIKRNSIDYKKAIYAFFLFAFPLIASLGTNLYLGQRVGCFVFSWIILYVELYDEIKPSLRKNGVLLLSVYGVIIIAQLALFRTWGHNDNVFHLKHENTPMSDLYLNSNQVGYFDKVIDICEKYNYSPDSSVVFGFNEDLATMYALGARIRIAPYGLEDFLFDDTYLQTPQPDFIFIPKRWFNEVNESKNRNWEWNDYDVYEVGTPDPFDYFDTNKKLYCKKKFNANANCQ